MYRLRERERERERERGRENLLAKGSKAVFDLTGGRLKGRSGVVPKRLSTCVTAQYIYIHIHIYAYAHNHMYTCNIYIRIYT